jgi:alpha-L-rhamnosidase
MSVHWNAAMISPVEDLDGAPLLRTEVALDPGHGDVTDARLHVSALGVFEATLNGAPVADDVLSPGWSSYEWRLRYRSYDVAALLEERTVLGLALGNGWYRGRLTWSGQRALYGDRLGAIAQLEITFADGHRQVVLTDDTWTAGPSATVTNDLYDGQTVDARRRDDSWTRPGATPAGFGDVEVLDFDTSLLAPYVGPPVVRQETLRPTEIWTSPAGRTLVDFGQNLVGWLKVRVRGEAGQQVTVRHAEVLEHGELGVRPLRTAEATDRFLLSGGDDVFEPTFTFHGFRYAEVEGWPGELTADDLEAVVVHSDLRRTGDFECSDPMLNQLHRNVVWGLKGNFLDVPSDCPQRDERLGWTGDIAVFAPTAAFLYDVDGFLRDWLVDVRLEQTAADGMVAFVVPDALKYAPPNDFPDVESTAIWSDAAVWVPWALWQAYGDRTVLEAQYDSMAAHVRRVESLLSPNGLWDTGFQFGDWLDPQAPPDDPIRSKADDGVVATSCLYRSARTVAEAAELLGRHDDAASFAELAAGTRDAFRKHYLHDDGSIESDAVTVYSLAIVFGLLDDDELVRAGERLAALVAQNGYHVATGFAGTPYVCDALTRSGRLDDAYRLLLERTCPSWLYPVTMGATTVWERWDAMLPDGTINPGQMTSFNHYALGAVADWLHRTVAGLAPAEPGYRTVRVAPRPGGGITWAKASLATAHGQIRVGWQLVDGELGLDIALPDGVTAEVDVLGAEPATLGAGDHRLSFPYPTERFHDHHRGDVASTSRQETRR